MLCGRLNRRGAAKLGIDWVPGRYVYWSARQRDERLLGHHPREAAAVDRHDAVLAGLDVPGPDQLDELVAVLGREVVVLRRVLVDVVQLPAGGVELARASRPRSGCRTRCRPRRTTGPATGRPPASRPCRWPGGRASRSTGCGAGWARRDRRARGRS